MPYTNPELVKKHIRLEQTVSGFRRDYPVTFADQEWVKLPGQGIVEDSVIVKAIHGHAPVFEEPIMIDGLILLANGHLVPNSVTIASDSSLGEIYKENIDYSVDCTNGTILPLSSGTIPTGSRLAVWYYYYSVYTRGSDYSVNYLDGTIKRTADSDIQPNQTVLIDYQLSGNQLNDDIIAEVVSEANAVVEKQVDPGREFGADMTLQAAATYMAVSLLCRIAAADDLKFNPYGRQTAPSWLSLADSYRHDCETLLKTFRPGAARLSRPTF